VITLGQPRGAEHHLAGGLPVVRLRPVLLVDDLDLDQRNRCAGLGDDVEDPILIPIEHMRFRQGERDDRAGLGHAVTGEHSHPQIAGGLGLPP